MNTSDKLVHEIPIGNNLQELFAFFTCRNNEFPIKTPDWDVARSGPEIELLQSKRILNDSEETLEAKRSSYTDQRYFLDQQWNEIRRKENLLRESFINFDSFIKENAEKRERAQRKINEEKKRQQKYQQEIDDLEARIQNLINIRDKMKESVDNYKVGQNYLESVINDTNEFESINAIFNRYENLMKARQTLIDLEDKHLSTLEKLTTEMDKIASNKEEKLISLNNELSSFQSKYEKRKAESLKWEENVTKIKNNVFEKNLELIQMKTACWNLYQQICKRKKIPIEYSDDVENQLVLIKHTINELKEIIEAAKEKAKEKSKK